MSWVVLSLTTKPPMATLVAQESSCSQMKPHLRSKWRVRTGGWHRPKPWQHSSSQYCLTQPSLVTSFLTKFMALCFLLLALTVGEFDLKLKKKKKKLSTSRKFMNTCRKTGEQAAEVCKTSEHSQTTISTECQKKTTHFAVYSHAVIAYSMSHCCQQCPTMNVIEAWSTSVKVQRHTE